MGGHNTLCIDPEDDRDKLTREANTPRLMSVMY